MNAKSGFQICHCRKSCKLGQFATPICAICTWTLGNPFPEDAAQANHTSFIDRRVEPMTLPNRTEKIQFVDDPGQLEANFPASEGQSLIRRSVQKYVVPDSGHLKTRRSVPYVECPAQKSVSPGFWERRERYATCPLLGLVYQ